MAPRVCLGSVANAGGEAADPCVFNGNGTGRPARALTHGRCVWCCPEEMARRLASPKLEKFLVYTLVNFKNANEEVFQKGKGRLPEDRRAGILAEVVARLNPPQEDDAEMAPVEKEVEGEGEENETEPECFAELGIVADDLSEGEGGELDVDAVDVGEVDFGNALGEGELPFELLDLEKDDAEMAEETENKENEVEAAPKRRRLRGKPAAPVYGPPLPRPAVAAVGAVAVANQARAPRPNERCPGRDNEACAWSTSQLNGPASITPRRGQSRCVFCSDEQLDKVLEQQRSGFQLTKTLTGLRELSDAKYEDALANLARRKGEAFAVDFELGRLSRRGAPAGAAQDRAGALERPSSTARPSPGSAERQRFEGLRAGSSAGSDDGTTESLRPRPHEEALQQSERGGRACPDASAARGRCAQR